MSRLGRAFVSFIRALFRLIAIVIVIGGIGAGIYVLWPAVHQSKSDRAHRREQRADQAIDI